MTKWQLFNSLANGSIIPLQTVSGKMVAGVVTTIERESGYKNYANCFNVTLTSADGKRNTYFVRTID